MTCHFRLLGVPLAALWVGCGPRSLSAILPAPLEEEGPVSDAAPQPTHDGCEGPEPTEALAELPPMGWNGWNYFGCDPAYNETAVIAAADAMVQSGMSAVGYQYVNIDDCWAKGRATDGTLLADPGRYPHGIKYVATYAHDHGLKFGIWAVSGPCTHDANSQGYEEADAATFASWGVDYVKYAVCGPEADQEMMYRRMRAALARTERPMVFSISAGHFAEWMRSIGDLWRIGPTNAATWASITSAIATDERLAAWARAGRWNDADMLEVGSGLAENESRAHFAVWAALASPLLAGNEIATMTSSTAALLTNREIIAINQDSLGIQAARVRTDSNVDVFAKPLSSCGARAVVVLNRGDAPANVRLDWSEIGLGAGTATMRDLLEHTNRPASANGTSLTVAGHDVVALKIVGEEVPRPKGDAYVSDLPWTYIVNGWGPAERNTSNGETAAGDGLPMTLRGRVYPKGLGVHAASLVRFRLGKACTRFTADVGIDDEEAGRGLATFEVWSDGVKLFDSGLVRGTSPVQRVDVDVTGRRELRLFVGTGPDGDGQDHGDWADAMVHCAP